MFRFSVVVQGIFTFLKKKKGSEVHCDNRVQDVHDVWDKAQDFKIISKS